ncbi:VOC family protein [Salinispora pacifica]|uniref:hypothetical protein n=1 Tax=Salinispora pacifica TaxID=351187 RepID=UPI0003A7A08B|nr:hypothetical protein [Salinispora pacifica]
MDRRTPTTEPAAAQRGETLLNDIEYRFRLMGQGPSPLSVDGRSLGHGLPRRAIALPELSAILMHPSCSYAARDAAWRLLVQHARTGDPAWRAGAVGVALPGLRFKAYLLAKLFTGDVQAAIVEHFLRALGTVELDRPGVVGHLLSAAFSKARTELRDLEPASSGAPNHAPGAVLPPAPYGHPDLVLARAVNAGAITLQEAELIGATYGGRQPDRVRRADRSVPLEPLQAAYGRRRPAQGRDRVRRAVRPVRRCGQRGHLDPGPRRSNRPEAPVSSLPELRLSNPRLGFVIP